MLFRFFRHIMTELYHWMTPPLCNVHVRFVMFFMCVMESKNTSTNLLKSKRSSRLYVFPLVMKTWTLTTENFVPVGIRWIKISFGMMRPALAQERHFHFHGIVHRFDANDNAVNQSSSAFRSLTLQEVSCFGRYIGFERSAVRSTTCFFKRMPYFWPSMSMLLENAFPSFR